MLLQLLCALLPLGLCLHELHAGCCRCLVNPLLQQLLHIFKLLGTPDESIWPGVTKLRDWHEFPRWAPQDLSKVFPGLEPSGVDLMRKMFEYDPARRISARDALAHEYFDDLDKDAVDLLESESVRALGF